MGWCLLIWTVHLLRDTSTAILFPIAGPLSRGTRLTVDPLWHFVGFNVPETINNQAGCEPSGKPLYFTKLTVDDETFIGKCAFCFMPHYVSAVGETYLRNHTHHILNNIDQFQWLPVTVETVEQLSEAEGVVLAHSPIQKLYGCRIEFGGWKQPCQDEERNDAKMASYGVQSLLPGVYKSGSHMPLFGYDGKSSRTLPDGQSFELLCYKYVQE